jgi:hypothetical protein
MQPRARFRLVLAVAVLALGLWPHAASAQNVPSYAKLSAPKSEEEIHGRIASIDGKYNITVRDDRGVVDRVQLHQGTIINPTGLTLEPGMRVKILGYNAGNVFEANEIDTPYHYAGPAVVPVYYGPGWWYPGYAWGYGPSFDLVVRGGPVVVRRPFRERPWPPGPPRIPPPVHGPYAGRH